MKQFYTHLIEIESIIISLDRMNLSQEEKLHLAHLVDSSLHHVILNAVFAELKNEDKKILLEYINNNSHDKIWKLLNEKVDGVEEKIKKAAGEVTKELAKDLKEAEKL